MKNLLNSISKIPVIALSAITLSTGAFADPIKVIFETDMEGDCDDAGALAMLHYYADQGDIELLAVITNSSADASVGVVDAINTYFDRPDTSDVKLGAYKGSSVGRTDAMMYEALDDNTSTYPHNVRSRNHADVQDPVSLYKELLTAHDDVVIISVGHLQNVSALIDDPEGYQLVEDKVKRLVVGGGSINYLQRPYNLTRWGSSETSLNVLNDFPAPMLFSTFYVGGPINTGQVLANNTSLNPVREAYRTFPTSANRQYFPNGSSTNGSAGPVLEVGRPSWDLLCVMIGTEKYPEYFNVNSYGYMSLDNSSTDENQHSTQWLSNTLNSNHENHSYVTLTRPLEEYEAIISQAMDYELIVGENLLQNGSFEADDIGYGEWDPVTSLTGWAAISGGQIELWDHAMPGIEPTDGSQNIELDVLSNKDGLYQNVQTNSDASYTISLDARLRPGSDSSSQSVEILWNNTKTGEFVPTSSWATYTFSVIGTGAQDRLTVQELSSQSQDGEGAIIDNIQLIESDTPPPPPPTGDISLMLFSEAFENGANEWGSGTVAASPEQSFEGNLSLKVVANAWGQAGLSKTHTVDSTTGILRFNVYRDGNKGKISFRHSGWAGPIDLDNSNSSAWSLNGAPGSLEAFTPNTWHSIEVELSQLNVSALNTVGVNAISASGSQSSTYYFDNIGLGD